MVPEALSVALDLKNAPLSKPSTVSASNPLPDPSSAVVSTLLTPERDVPPA